MNTQILHGRFLSGKGLLILLLLCLGFVTTDRDFLQRNERAIKEARQYADQHKNSADKVVHCTRSNKIEHSKHLQQCCSKIFPEKTQVHITPGLLTS